MRLLAALLVVVSLGACGSEPDVRRIDVGTGERNTDSTTDSTRTTDTSATDAAHKSERSGSSSKGTASEPAAEPANP